MPRYFFNVIDGQSSRDTEGIELPDIARAKAAAITLSGELLRDLGSFWSGPDWRLEVTDAHGRVLFTFRFSMEEHDLRSGLT